MASPIDGGLEGTRSEDMLALLGRRPGARVFSVGSTIWSAYEDRHPHFGRSLIFESERCARRVRDYPTNWHDLTDEQLAALSLSR